MCIRDSSEDELNRGAEKNAREIARLKENERYRKEFLGNVSHEIKTPIFTLQGYIVTLLDGAIEDKAVNRKYLERSEKNIYRLIHIVDDLEEISKLEAGAPVLEKEWFDVVALVREIADSLEMDAARRRIGIRVGNPHGQPPVPVTADRRRIAQVITCLLYTSTGRAPIVHTNGQLPEVRPVARAVRAVATDGRIFGRVLRVCV